MERVSWAFRFWRGRHDVQVDSRWLFEAALNRTHKGGSMNNRAFIASLLLIAPGGAVFANAAFTLPSGVHVQITEEKFQRNQFKIVGCKNVDKSCLINGHIPFGIMDSLPSTYLKAITVSYLGHSYSLDVANMYDAWDVRPLEFKGSVRYFGGSCSDNQNCRFRGLFSDGAATFVAEWCVVNGSSTRTVLTDSSDVVDLFMRHIDPPDLDSQ
jgi:hypothetical protein